MGGLVGCVILLPVPLEPPRAPSNRTSQSLSDASFIAKGKTDGVANRTPPSTRGGANPADREREWIVQKHCSDAGPTTDPQMPPLRSSLCAARSSRSAFVSDAWEEKEESGLMVFQGRCRRR